MELQETLSLSSPLAWGIYIYCVLSFILAGALFYVRTQILHVQWQRLHQELPPIHAQLVEGREQLVEVNQEAYQGIKQVKAFLRIIDGCFIPLLEKPLVKWILAKMGDPEGLVKMGIQKGVGAVFARVDDLIQLQEEQK